MPDRIIRERALTSPTLDLLSAEAERLHWRLTVVADDYGRFDADPRVLLAKCFPLKVGQLRAEQLEPWRNQLVAAGLVQLYQVRDRLYGVYPTWPAHQRKRDSKPKYPPPEEGIAYVPPVAASCRRLPRVAARARTLESRESLTSESRESLTTESREPGNSGSGGNSPPPAAVASRQSQLDIAPQGMRQVSAADPALASCSGPDEPPESRGGVHAHAAPTRQTRTTPAGNGSPPFALWPEIDRALKRCPFFGKVSKLDEPDWWLAQLEANPTVDLVSEVLKAEAWVHSNPERTPRKRPRQFLHRWLAHAERDE